MDGLSSICAGLGISEEDDSGKCIGYSKGEYCSDNMKDLLRFLRRDDPEKRDVFKQVCKWNIVSKDLIPIIVYCEEDRGLVLNAVKVLVFLTMPVEPTSTEIPMQIEYVWRLKSAITFSDIFPVILSFLESPLENLENESFTEDDWKLVQLVLSLFRNVLAIQDISTQQKVGGSATQFLFLRDRCLELLFRENVMDLILVLSLHTGGSRRYLQQENLLLLEIFHYIFKGQDPGLIAKASLEDSKVEDGAGSSSNSLQSIMKAEKEKRKLTRFHNLSCYSQFSGTFARTTLDGYKALFQGNPSAPGVALLRAHKKYRGPSKREIWDHGKLASAKDILILLDDFIGQFLMGGYNVLMQSIREDIDKEHQEFQSNDVRIFFEVAQFVTSFQFYKCSTKPSMDVENKASTSFDDTCSSFNGSICGAIAETLNESMFQLVISRWRCAFEGLKQTNDYRFLSVAGSLVKIMIRMLDLVLKQSPEASTESHTARILLYKLFYDQTEEGLTHFLFSLIKSFDTYKQPKSDLTNLVESMYLVLRLLENLQARGSLRVSKKLRKKKKKKTDRDINGENEDSGIPLNDVASSAFEESVNGNVPGNDTLENHNSDKELENNQKNSIEDEPLPQLGSSGSSESEPKERNNVDHDGFNLETDNSLDDEQLVSKDEVDFKASSLVSALANHTIIERLCWLLSNYKSNSIITNHHIVSMLQRVCDDLDLSPMLYQLSFLTVFYDILEEQKSRPCKAYENVVTFLTTLVRRMLRKMKNYPLLFVEVLFWKSQKECRYISCESVLNDIRRTKNASAEGKSSAEVARNGSGEILHRSLADALGDDDFEDSRLHGKEEENFDEQTSRSSKRRRGIILSDEIGSRLQDLYVKYKDSPNCCQLISEGLDPNGDISKEDLSKELRLLGLRVPSVKTKGSNICKKQKAESDSSTKTATDLNSTVPEESAVIRKPMQSRKRVHAFSSDQEQKIKDLFDQFKDQKRCSYMIAQALDGNGTISAARISFKLKQLGLFVPKRKQSQAKMQLMDEVSSDRSSGGSSASDDETLLSSRTRSKETRNASHHDDSGNKVAPKLHEDTSDDELLSSLLVRKKKKLRKADSVELMTDALEENLFASNAIGGESLILDRYESEPSAEIGITTLNNSESTIEAVGIELEPKHFSKADNSDDPLPPFDNLPAEELADSDEDIDNYTTYENSARAPRRRIRMVLDLDEEDA